MRVITCQPHLSLDSGEHMTEATSRIYILRTERKERIASARMDLRRVPRKEATDEATSRTLIDKTNDRTIYTY